MTIEAQTRRGERPPNPEPAAATLAPSLHVLVIATASPGACLDAVAGVLRRSACEVRGFSLKPVGGSFEAVLRIAGLDALAADKLADSIAAWPGAGAVRLEHHLVRP